MMIAFTKSTKVSKRMILRKLKKVTEESKVPEGLVLKNQFPKIFKII